MRPSSSPTFTLLTLIALPLFGHASVTRVTIDDGGANPPVSGLKYYPSLDTPGVWTNTTNAPEFIQTTVHTTYQAGGAATLTFIGTGIQFIGSQNVDHGMLSVILDGKLTPVDGKSPNNSFIPQVQQFSASDLDQFVPHVLTVINAEDTAHALDLDGWVVLSDSTQPMPAAGAGTWPAPTGTSANATIHDGSSAVRYYPSDGSSWAQTTGKNYLNGGVHTCQADGGGATITFNGSAIYFVSTLNPSGGPFVAILDGVVSPLLGAFSTVTMTQQVLWSATGLNETQEHTATIVMIGSGIDSVQRKLDVDGFIVTSTGSSDSGDAPASTSGGPSEWLGREGRGRTLAATAAGLICALCTLV